jgi:hypothetical protein
MWVQSLKQLPNTQNNKFKVMEQITILRFKTNK